MVYIARLKARERFFEKPFKLKEADTVGTVQIVSDKRGKKAFLKQRPCEAVFTSDAKNDEILGDALHEIVGGVYNIMLPHTGELLSEAVRFSKRAFPLEEIAVFGKSDEAENVIGQISDMARVITIVGEEGEGEARGGIYIRRVKNLTKTPSAAIFMSRSAPLFRVPAIDLRDDAEAGPMVVSKDNVTFKKPEFLSALHDEDISAASAAYFIKNGCDFKPRICAMRKKSPKLFVFS